MFSIRPSGDSGVRFFRTNLKTSALPHQFQWRRFNSKVTFWKRTSLTVPPSCTLMPNARLEFRTTILEKSTCRMSAYVSVPITIAVDDEERMLLLTVTFSVGRTGRLVFAPLLFLMASLFRQIASSAVVMMESEIRTLDEETISMPSALTPFSRSEYT